MYRFPMGVSLSTDVMKSCDTQFDARLLQIPHYRNHPEMLPFIGVGYTKTPQRVLLVGESHYVSNAPDEDGEVRDVAADFAALDWYASAPRFDDEKNVFCSDFGNYTTRHILNRFVADPTFGGGGLLIFSNPLRAYYDAEETRRTLDKSLIHNFAFLNFYQRPAFAFGSSLNTASSERTMDLQARDAEVAAKTLDAVIETIEPAVVIFLSSKAYNAYVKTTHIRADVTKAPVLHRVPHPTCAWWNRPTKRGTCGKDDFRSILRTAWKKP